MGSQCWPQQVILAAVVGLCTPVLGSLVLAEGLDPEVVTIAQADLTGEDVREFIREMEEFTNEKNSEEIVKRIAPDADFQITSEIGGTPLAVKYEELDSLFTEGFSDLEFYEINLSIETIEISGDTAVVTGKTADRSSVDGKQLIVSDVSWTNELELRDGQLQIIKWESNVNSYCVSEL